MGFFDSMWGGNKSNPANAAAPYLNAIPSMTNMYLQPYMAAGNQAMPILENQYNELLQGPGNKLNQIGQSYQQSPGLQFAIQQAMQGAGHAAAAGGMAGSPQHEQQNMQLANNLAQQDYGNWLNGAMGLYGKGLSGEQGLYGGGLQSSMSMADMIASALAQQANMQFRGQQEKNSGRNSFLGGLGNLAGSALGAFNPFSQVGSLAGPMSGSPYSPWNEPG